MTVPRRVGGQPGGRHREPAPALPFVPVTRTNQKEWCYICNQAHPYHKPTREQMRMLRTPD